MTMITAAEAASQPLTDHDSVLTRVRSLIGRAEHRCLWFLFLSSDGIQLPIVLPVDDYPPEPGAEAPVVADVVGDLMRARQAASVIVVWERVLGAEATSGDRAWASALAIAFARADISLRGQLVCHRGGVRWFPADEYL
jgi:hypothetical protein